MRPRPFVLLRLEQPRSGNKTISCGLILSLVLTAAAHAAPGDLDTTFAGTGKSRIGFGFGQDFGRVVAVQADGKLIMAGYSANNVNGGDFAVVRFDTNNVLDSSFGTGGKVVVDFGDGGDDTGYALALDPIGRAVVAGDASARSVQPVQRPQERSRPLCALCVLLWRFTPSNLSADSAGTAPKAFGAAR